MNIRTKGYIIGAIAAATYGTNPIFAIPLYKNGMDTNSVLFFRYLLAIPIIIVMMKMRGRTFSLKKKEILPVISMGIVMSVSSLALFESYNYIGAGIASTILFVYPILVAIIMALLFHERLGWLGSICIALAIGGIFMLYQTEDGTTINIKGVLFVLLSASSYAIYLVYVNHSILKDMATLKLTLYVLIFGLLVYFSISNFGRELSTPSHWYMWFNLLGLAVLPTAISFYCTTQAIMYIGSTPTAILGALEPLTAVLLGIVLLQEPITFRILTGMIMIIMGVSIIITGGKLSAMLVRIRKMFPVKLRIKRH